MKIQLKIIAILLIFFWNIQIFANVKLPSVISDNMVLQQNTNVAFWGKASPNEKITIKPSWGGIYSTTAGTDSTWIVKIKTPSAISGQSINIEAINNIHIKNVLIGEVWLCSGQSNMDFPVAKSAGWRTGIINEDEEMKDADYPEIRLFHVTQRLSPEAELDYCEGHWEICNKETLKEFSAVAFFFGRKLYKELHMPVGLIQSTWGGTPAEAWTKMSVMNQDTVYAPLVKDFYNSRDNYQDNLEKYEKEKASYDRIMADTVGKNKEQVKKPQKPLGIYHNKALSTLWNAMIHPLVPYTIKGVIWYQGESNSVRHWNYTHVFTNMITSWRQEWNQGEFPFYFVQIAPHYKQPPQIREAQLKTWQSVKRTGMVVITDAGDSTDIHPRNKKIPGERLANWALTKDYGKNTPFSGPVYKSMQIKKNKITLSFNYTENGLKADGEHLTGFAVAGADKVFHPATATILGNKIEITSPEVSSPVAVRYGWDFFFRTNLYNGAGLPASPFRTDSWTNKN